MSQESSGTVSAGPPVTADPQDPLPESAWYFRRWFVFSGAALCLAATFAVLFMVHALGRATLEVVAKIAASRDARALDQALEVVLAVIDAQYKLGAWSMLAMLILSGLYLVAPSAEQAGKWMATLSAWKGGISTSVQSRVSSASGTASTSTTAGPAAVEPSPPAPSAPAAPAAAGGTRVSAGGRGHVPPTVDLSNE